MNIPTGTIDQFSVTLNWELSAVDSDLVDKVMISTEWTSLLVYSSGSNSKRQITGNTATVTITDPTITQQTLTNLQPFSHYCFTVTALYAFEGQALGEVAAEPFCTNTSEAGKLYNQCSIAQYMFLCLMSYSSICTTRCNSSITRICITHCDLDHSSVTEWHYTKLYSKNTMPYV